jgi:23S rRNA U2552 (ribose-2'-O)-methylase RlmE/FtsJ
MKTLKEIYNQTATEHAGLGDKGTLHSYIDGYYESAFGPFRDSATRVLEVGINRGHSLVVWKEFFPNAEIIGVDIADYGIRDANFTLIYGDATKEETFNGIDNIDIAIDDGSHMLEHQLRTFMILFPKLKKGGLYVIEDIQDIDATITFFKNLDPSFDLYDLRTVKGRYDDVIIQFTK